MSAIDKRLERATKVAQVIAEHPDLPMICLAPSTPSDYDSYYHDVVGASVQKMLFPIIFYAFMFVGALWASM